MKKVSRKKLTIKKIIFIIILIFSILYLYKNTDIFKSSNQVIAKIISNTNDDSEYKIIKQNFNSNYQGIGQEKISDSDGYFTTFTTEQKNKKIYKEYKQNGNSSWSSKEYWGGTMEENGCGITSLSIILSGYNKNYTPEDLRQKYFPVLTSDKISSELESTFGIENSDFYYDSTHLSNKSIIEHLKTNRPILICVWNQPNNNRWTTASHYMVLLAATDDEKVYVSNPNGLENDSKSSGWYNINEITPYLAKALYIETY